MKFNKRFISFAVTLIIIFSFFTANSIPVLAHGTVLDVIYDDCIGIADNDGIDEMWYVLERGDISHHISHETTTIRYRFEEDPEWIPVGLPEAVGEEIKEAFSNSIEKWNNIYFYSYNSNGTITKRKLINIVEVTSGECEVIIRPDTDMMPIARTAPDIDGTENPGHHHYSSWIMDVNVDYFSEDTYLHLTSEEVDWVMEAVGAHEFGHILGLRDVDYIDNENNHICNSELGVWHHEEVLMGYGNNFDDRSRNITYKDIAGVAITRGFHTDSDHKWLNMGQQSDGTYKLVCSICNGILSVTASELSEYSYLTYGSCNNEHELSDGNMMAVASYGNKDYYKCKYCRYVAPFSELVTQNYEKTCYSSYAHKCVNTVEGLEYSFNESHTLVDGECTKCTSHTYASCEDVSKLFHKRVCGCGEFILDSHYVYSHNVIPGTTYASCEGCGRILNLQTDHYEAIVSITQVSVNGSYILPNGIVVLVEEDIEAYLAGTLQFYHPENVPVTQ